jgi:hypothetical protein
MRPVHTYSHIISKIKLCSDVLLVLLGGGSVCNSLYIYIYIPYRPCVGPRADTSHIAKQPVL